MTSVFTYCPVLDQGTPDTYDSGARNEGFRRARVEIFAGCDGRTHKILIGVIAVVELKEYIREIPDFPSPGILFRDITPLLKNPAAFKESVNRIASYSEARSVDAFVAIDARGFLFASPLAYNLGKPLIPVRKEGKLPFDTHTVSYELEYGQDSVEVHTDAITKGQNILIVDDLLATGGTMAAAVKLVEKTGGNVVGLAVLIELKDLKGRELLKGYDILSLIKY